MCACVCIQGWICFKMFTIKTNLRIKCSEFNLKNCNCRNQRYPQEENDTSFTQSIHSFSQKITLGEKSHKKKKNIFKKFPKEPKQDKSSTSAKVAANTGSV